MVGAQIVIIDEPPKKRPWSQTKVSTKSDHSAVDGWTVVQMIMRPSPLVH